MSSNADKIKLIVYVNFGILALATIFTIYKITLMVIEDRDISSVTDDKPGKKSTERVIYVIISWIIVAVINVILLKGLTQRSHTKCLIWLVLAGVGTIYQVNRVIRSFISHDDYIEAMYLLIWTFISIYGMYVVKSFMNEIKADSTFQPLTSK